jgi:hypothetical protein
VKAWRIHHRFDQLLLPFLDDLDHEGVSFRVGMAASARQIETPAGFTFKVLADNVIVEFSYPAVEEGGPGELGHFRLPDVRPYSDLLEQAVGYACRLIGALGAGDALRADRIGVIAACKLTGESAPPGVRAILDHADSAWKTPVRRIETNPLVLLRQDEQTLDQCHHLVRLDRSAPAPEVVLQLDWQRVFATAQGPGPVAQLLPECASQATAYFQQVGEGVVNVR